jgi:hypothetical protein
LTLDIDARCTQTLANLTTNGLEEGFHLFPDFASHVKSKSVVRTSREASSKKRKSKGVSREINWFAAPSVKEDSDPLGKKLYSYYF